MTSILVDGREFVAGRQTGIGRFFEGLLLAMLDAHADWRLCAALHRENVLPASLVGRVDTCFLPGHVELAWPRLARGYDLFISPYPKLPWQALPCPAIHTVHDVLYLTHPAYRGNAMRVMLSTRRLKRALSLASLTWFDSAASMQECRAFGHVRNGVVRFPAIAPDFTPGKAASQEPYFLYVGNGLPHKNVPVLIEAIGELPARLVLVGVRGSTSLLAGQGKDVVSRVDCPDRVGDAQLLALYRGATALLLPSTAEGYGYPPLEAMACGTPAIVADIPVLRETTGGAAVLCDAHDARAWREAMAAMLQPATRASWSDKGLAWAQALQSPAGWRQHIDDIESLLQGG